MASGIYNCAKADFFGKQVDLVNDTINVALYDDSHAFTATDTVYTSTNELATANGYTQDNKALANKSLSGTTTCVWKADPTVWTATGAGFTAYHAVVYSVTNTKSLICNVDFGGAQTASGGGTFTITWDASNGILNLA